jgi:hypothetical protein
MVAFGAEKDGLVTHDKNNWWELILLLHTKSFYFHRVARHDEKHGPAMAMFFAWF